MAGDDDRGGLQLQVEGGSDEKGREGEEIARLRSLAGYDNIDFQSTRRLDTPVS